MSSLALHNQVKKLPASSELKKLIQLKEETGELSEQDEKQYRFLKRAAESELLKVGKVFVLLCIVFAWLLKSFSER